MKFNEYLDIVYINTNLEVSEKFDLKKQALTRSIPDLIGWQRSFYKLCAYFKLIFGYLIAKAYDDYPKRHEFKVSPVETQDGQTKGS